MITEILLAGFFVQGVQEMSNAFFIMLFVYNCIRSKLAKDTVHCQFQLQKTIHYTTG